MRFPVFAATLLVFGHLSVAHAQTPEPGGVEQAGWQAIIDGEADTAVAAFSKAIEAEPKRAPLYLGAGLAALLDKREDDAIAYFEHALELDPTLTMARVQLATARYRQRDLDEAITLLQAVVDQRPGEAQVATTLRRWKEERERVGKQ